MTGGAVARASLNGTVELLALSLAGSYLAHLNILRGAAILALSESTSARADTARACSRHLHANHPPCQAVMMEVLIPAILYISVLDAIHTALASRTSSSLAAIIFPPLWGIIVPVIGCVVAVIVVRVFARGKAEPVQRVILLCIMMGNAGNMPLLILFALCDNFAPLGDDPKCVPQSFALASMYCITWEIILVRTEVPIFTILFSSMFLIFSRLHVIFLYFVNLSSVVFSL